MPTMQPHRRAFALLSIALAVGFAFLSASPTLGRTRFEYRYPVVGHSGYAHRHSRYPATDIIARCGRPVVSAVNGVVLGVSRKNLWANGVRNGSTRGGLFVSIRGNDGVRYYNSHLSKIVHGIKAGVRVSAGQKIGEVGRTGRAGSCHLHFGISPVCAGTGDWWIRRGVVWPWPYLDSWRKKPRFHRSPRHEIKQWRQAYGCPSGPKQLPLGSSR